MKPTFPVGPGAARDAGDHRVLSLRWLCCGRARSCTGRGSVWVFAAAATLLGGPDPGDLAARPAGQHCWAAGCPAPAGPGRTGSAGGARGCRSPAALDRRSAAIRAAGDELVAVVAVDGPSHTPSVLDNHRRGLGGDPAGRRWSPMRCASSTCGWPASTSCRWAVGGQPKTHHHYAQTYSGHVGDHGAVGRRRTRVRAADEPPRQRVRRWSLPRFVGRDAGRVRAAAGRAS